MDLARLDYLGENFQACTCALAAMTQEVEALRQAWHGEDTLGLAVLGEDLAALRVQLGSLFTAEMRRAIAAARRRGRWEVDQGPPNSIIHAARVTTPGGVEGRPTKERE